MSETQFFKQEDGSRIAYKVLEPHNSESETPLVLLIGLWCTKEYFMGLEEELAKNRKVIVLDNRGIGESSVVSLDDPISLNLMAQDTIALVRHLGIKKFNLLGWSMGGCISFYIALDLPSDLKLEKLIICSCYAEIPESSQAQAYTDLYNSSSEPSFPKNIQEQKDQINDMLESVFIDYLLEHPDKFDKLADIMLNTNRPFGIFKRQWEALILKPFNVVSELQKIKIPTLMIHGEADKWVPIRYGEFLASEIPNSKLARIPRAGHIFWVTEPKTANIINDFLLE